MLHVKAHRDCQRCSRIPAGLLQFRGNWGRATRGRASDRLLGEESTCIGGQVSADTAPTQAATGQQASAVHLEILICIWDMVAQDAQETVYF